MQLEERNQLLIHREDKAEALADHAERLQRRRETEHIKRAQ
jgi:hypothetical protein